MSIEGLFGREYIEDENLEDAFTLVRNHEYDIKSINEKGYEDYNWCIDVYVSFTEVELMIHINYKGAKLKISREEEFGEETETIAELPDVTELANSLDFTEEASFIEIHNYCARRLNKIKSALYTDII